MSDSRKPLFKLVMSGIKLTFVDNFGLNADYLVHLNRKRKDVGGSREAYPEGKEYDRKHKDKQLQVISRYGTDGLQKI